MDNKLRYAVIGMVIALIATPILGILLLEDPQFSVIVMMEIAVVGFFTVIFVMIIGSREDHYPTSAADSPSVLAWSQREAAAQQANAAKSAERIEEASGAE
ncbi:MAG: hypothetical protein WBC91_03790 [Phototrophicaceae bacterium]